MDVRVWVPATIIMRDADYIYILLAYWFNDSTILITLEIISTSHSITPFNNTFLLFLFKTFKKLQRFLMLSYKKHYLKNVLSNFNYFKTLFLVQVLFT